MKESRKVIPIAERGIVRDGRMRKEDCVRDLKGFETLN